MARWLLRAVLVTGRYGNNKKGSFCEGGRMNILLSLRICSPLQSLSLMERNNDIVIGHSAVRAVANLTIVKALTDTNL